MPGGSSRVPSGTGRLQSTSRSFSAWAKTVVLCWLSTLTANPVAGAQFFVSHAQLGTASPPSSLKGWPLSWSVPYDVALTYQPGL
jgi:hypothetical protein